MKTFKQIFRLVALSVAVMVSAIGCSTDKTEIYDWLDQPFEFDITYSTGEAVWSAENPETLILNKLGVGMTGTVPYIKIKSSAFWTLSVPDDCTWLRLSLSSDTSFADGVKTVGGPTSDIIQTDDKSVNVYIKLNENKGENQETSLVFKFSESTSGSLVPGATYRVPILQRGALSVEESSNLTFLKDSFGKVDGEDVRVKFYPFSCVVRGEDGTETNQRTYSGVATAGDPNGRPFGYAGSDNCYATDDDPSNGYNILTESNDISASGDANIRIDSNGYFEAQAFNNHGKTSFQLFFAAKNEYGKFSQRDLKVWVSCDGKSWDIDANAGNDGSIAYNIISTSDRVNGWAVARARFSIVPGISNVLYFRFENVSGDVYHIDDVLIEEYNGDTDQIFSLIETGADVIGLPVNFDFTNLKSDGTSVKGDYWLSNLIVLSNESGVYEDTTDDYTPPTVVESTWSSAHIQFMTGSDISLVKTRSDLSSSNSNNNGKGWDVASNCPRVIGAMKDDYFIWTIPVHNMAASTNLKANFCFKSTSAGPKYFTFQWAQCHDSEYKFSHQNIMQPTEEEKRAFYASLDWTVADPVTIEVPGMDDYSGTDNATTYSGGIPVGSAANPTDYWKGEITYSRGFWSDTTDRVVEYVCNFPEAMEDGYLFVRLVAAENLTAGATNSTNYQRINKTTNAGTIWLTKTARFSFDSCGQQSEYNNKFRVLASIDESRYNGQSVDVGPVYNQANDAAVAGMFAGSTANMPAYTQGNNLLNGGCEEDETGAKVYFYSPYNEANETVNDILLSVPTHQTFDSGYLVANSVPVVSNNDVTFKTTTTMRIGAEIQSAILELDLYVGKLLSSNLSKIEISTVNPDDLSAETTNIAGAYHYDLVSGTRGEAGVLVNTITAEALSAMAIPDKEREPLKLYFGLWEGTHKLYLKLYLGQVYYVVPLEVAEYEKNCVVRHTVKVDNYPSYSTGEAPKGINSAETFRAFCQAVKDGKKGKDLDQYRNNDGELGFGGALRPEDMVIDMADQNMETWPMGILNENFNGGNYVIKNMHIVCHSADNDYDTDRPNAALFQRVAYGYTISNITFDESCSLKVYVGPSSGKNTYCASLLMIGDENGKTASGNIYNVNNYGSIDVSGENFASVWIGSICALGVCSSADDAAPSTITSCKNYGKYYIHDISRVYKGSHGYATYAHNGCLVGGNYGMTISDCDNYGQMVVERSNCEWGTVYLGGIAGYNTNRINNNNCDLLGVIQNCHNYGQLLVGQDGGSSVFHTAGFAGIAPRMQWGELVGCENHANFKVKAIVNDCYGESGWQGKTTWEAQIKGTTNTLAFFSVGGIFAFAQQNKREYFRLVDLLNSGNIEVEADMEGTITYADNAGISVGGISGRMGANAKGPQYEGCTNTGNITLKSNAASAEALVGGICGHFVSNNFSTGITPYMRASSNAGTITFKTDNPEGVIAHVGGIAGGAIYGDISNCVNAGAVVNGSTNEASKSGSILGVSHRSQITAKSSITPAFTLDGNGVAGSVNGVQVTKDNYKDYIYGGYEAFEPYMPSSSTTDNTNYYFSM